MIDSKLMHNNDSCFSFLANKVDSILHFGVAFAIVFGCIDNTTFKYEQ